MPEAVEVVPQVELLVQEVLEAVEPVILLLLLLLELPILVVEEAVVEMKVPLEVQEL